MVPAEPRQVVTAAILRVYGATQWARRDAMNPMNAANPGKDSHRGRRPREEQEDEGDGDAGQRDDEATHGESDRIGGGGHLRCDEHVLEAKPLLVEVHALRGKQTGE